MYNIVKKLEEITVLTRTGRLPKIAGNWAEGALITTLNIILSIEDRVDGGTERQLSALQNIEDAADKWL